MVKLTAELIEQAAQYTNAVRDRELDLRGESGPPRAASWSPPRRVRRGPELGPRACVLARGPAFSPPSRAAPGAPRPESCRCGRQATLWTLLGFLLTLAPAHTHVPALLPVPCPRASVTPRLA